MTVLEFDLTKVVFPTHEGAPRKVLHVLNGAAGGAALSVLGLIEVFRRQGIAACAVCHDAGSAAERDAIRDATEGQVLFTPLYWWNKKTRAAAWKRPLIELRQKWRTGFPKGSVAAVARFATECGADLIHTNNFMTPEGGLAARQLRLPHVWHVRELLGPGSPYRLPLEGPRLGPYVEQHASKVIANSHASAKPLQAWLPPGLLEVVPNGIDLSAFTARTGGTVRRELVVGMVGSLTSQSKKHALFIDAAARVDRSLPIRWRIYGHDPSQGGTERGGTYIEALHKRIAQHGLADRFDWPGFVSQPARIMNEIDVLVHPADIESFGRIVVEAMAAGLPVVGVAGGGVGEIIAAEETGLLAPPDDPAALAAAVERLARDTDLRTRLGAAGRRRAEQHYSIESCAAGVLRVYKMAMARPLGDRSSVTTKR